MSFQTIMDTIKDKTIEQFRINTTHGNMIFAIVRQSNYDNLFGVKDGRLWNCRNCCKAYNMYHNYTIGGIPILSIMMGPLQEKGEESLLAHITELCMETKDNPIIDIQILRQPNKEDAPGSKAKNFLGGFVDIEGSFDHINLPLPTDIPNETLVLYQAMYNRYIKQGQLIRLIKKAKDHGVDSCDIMITACDTVSGADRFLPALRWIKDLLTKLGESEIELDTMNLIQKFMFLMPFLIASHHGPDPYDGAVSFHCVHLAEIIGMFEAAPNLPGLIGLMKERLNPITRGVKTVEASESQLSAFKILVGTYVNNTVNPDLLPNVVRMLNLGEPGDAPVNAQPVAVGFAAKVSKSDKIKSLKTIDAMVKYMAENPHTELSIKKFNSVMVIVTTTMNPDLLCVPYFWGYPTEAQKIVQSEQYGMISEWLKVTHIIPMWKDIGHHDSGRQSMFVIEGATYPGRLRIGHQSFLKSSYHSYARAFQDSIPAMTVNPGPTALGLGVGAKDQYNNTDPTQFRLDGIDITISRLF